MEAKLQTVITVKIEDHDYKMVADQDAPLGGMWDAVNQFRQLIAENINLQIDREKEKENADASEDQAVAEDGANE